MEKLSKLLKQAQELEQARRSLLEHGKLRLEPEAGDVVQEHGQKPETSPKEPRSRES